MAQPSTTSDEADMQMERGRSRRFSSSSLRHLPSSSFRSIARSEDQMLSAFSEEDCRREDDELELQWAAIERLPTYQRLRTAVFGREVACSNLPCLVKADNFDYII
ncbi:hypothetical protein ACJRO7_006461 [Eucalyptus globulus]|uniref:Uncharacterized protein n=1 Tax=Eucalyptus globulus TaxID=34317 RepID=A0ABD3IL66_EUCGL